MPGSRNARRRDSRRPASARRSPSADSHRGEQWAGTPSRAGAAAVTSTRRLFGTDGVRGVAGEFLTADLALALGRAAAAASPEAAPTVLIVRDTRESGEMLEGALAAGVAAA